MKFEIVYNQKLRPRKKSELEIKKEIRETQNKMKENMEVLKE